MDSGACEIPYMIYVLTFWPALLAVTLLLSLVMMPYSVVHFAHATASHFNHISSAPSNKIQPVGGRTQQNELSE
eukprot:scaffold660639_cov62-Prasinocladus_malaysianus.AAC.1